MFFCQVLEYFIEKKFDLSTRVWVSIFDAPKLFSRGQTLGTKNAKKCCHVGTLEAFHLWSLATSVKAQRSTSRLSTNHIAGFLHLSNQPAKCEDPLTISFLRKHLNICLVLEICNFKKLMVLLLCHYWLIYILSYNI